MENKLETSKYNISRVHQLKDKYCDNIKSLGKQNKLLVAELNKLI